MLSKKKQKKIKQKIYKHFNLLWYSNKVRFTVYPTGTFCDFELKEFSLVLFFPWNACALFKKKRRQRQLK